MNVERPFPDEVIRELKAPAFWRYWTLVHRILAVNLLPIIMFAFGIIWLDAYRDQLAEERVDRLAANAAAAAAAVQRVEEGEREALLAALGRAENVRLRIYGPDGALTADSWRAGPRTYRLEDPDAQPLAIKAARVIDRGFNAIVGSSPVESFAEPARDRAAAWPEVQRVLETDRAVTRTREAPDRTPVFSAAVPAANGGALLATINDLNYTNMVRRERGSLAILLLGALLLGVLLSLFLARTIARPLRRIAIAARRVRAGRARQVTMPRLPNRYDEVGTLALAVGDMSRALQDRIDKIEAFAADVTHELKNPLASLRSAVDGLERIEDPALRAQLLDVVRQDVVRLDRLISDISEAARTDAELTRTQMERVDLGPLVGGLVESWQRRRELGSARLAFDRPPDDRMVVAGEPTRLARAIDNLLDNAISFSPAGGVVKIRLVRENGDVRLTVEDEGPGVAPEHRDAIFHRFNSYRPTDRDFGRHSGLGLAIASAIVEGHGGDIAICDRPSGAAGACFSIRLDAWSGDDFA